MTNMFTPPPEQINDQEIQAFAEKYKNDPVEMAKALAHANKFIDTLKAEKAQSMTVEDAIAQIKAGMQTPPSTTQPPTVVTPSNVLDENTLNSKVEELLNKKDKTRRDTEAKALVEATLVERFGTADKASVEFNKKAAELGMSSDELQAIAIRSPKALFNMFGIDGNRTSNVNTSPNRSTVNTEARRAAVPAPSGSELDKYTSILREKGGYEKYMSRGTQIEIMKKAMENPAAFGINV